MQVALEELAIEAGSGVEVVTAAEGKAAQEAERQVFGSVPGLLGLKSKLVLRLAQWVVRWESVEE